MSENQTYRDPLRGSKNKKEYKESDYNCEKAVEDNKHVLACEAYEDLREDKDLNNNEDLAMYLRMVLQTRDRLRLTR